MRDRLIKLLAEAYEVVKRNGFNFNAAIFADYLLENGVEVVTHCKDCKYSKQVSHRGEPLNDVYRCTYLEPNTSLFGCDFCRYGKVKEKGK